MLEQIRDFLTNPIIALSLLVSIVVVVLVHSAKKRKTKGWILDAIEMFFGAVVAATALLITAEEIWWMIYYSSFESAMARLILTFAIIYVILAMLHKKQFPARAHIFIDVVEDALSRTAIVFVIALVASIYVIYGFNIAAVVTQFGIEWTASTQMKFIGFGTNVGALAGIVFDMLYKE